MIDEVDEKEIQNCLARHFGIENEAMSVVDLKNSDLDLPVPDLIFEAGQKRFYVEIAPKSEITKISHLTLIRELIKADNKDSYDDLFILLYKTISERSERIAKKVGIVPVRAPLELMLAKYDRSAAVTKVKTTTEKAWYVIYKLLRMGPVSIKKVADASEVSYGWAHTVINSLVDQKLATKEYDLVKITDLGKLINGMAWERPLESLKIDEVIVNSETSYTAAREISSNLKAYNVKFAFNSITAGSLYTGKVMRHDTAYLYLEKHDLNRFRELFSSSTNTGIKIKIFVPDREVFSESQERESVTITSPGQTLLDLACSGYGNMELTMAMAEYHETQ